MNRRLTRKQARELEAMERAFMRSPAALVATHGRRRIVAAHPAYRRLACPPGTYACGCAGWRHLAEHDALTGLPNRAQLESELVRALARAARHRERLALLFIDLDGFKQVNDGQGHARGDGLLREVGTRMRQTLRGEDLLARWGGDEFVVLIEAPRQPADAAAAALALLRAVKDAAADPGARSPRVTASIGIAMYPDHAGDAAQLLGTADAAMYGAKRAGGDAFAFASASGCARSTTGPLRRPTMATEAEAAHHGPDLERR